jgi:hypothetical protein
MNVNPSLKHLKAAAILALLSLEARDEHDERRCIDLADWHLFEAQRLRRNAELDSKFERELEAA